MFTMPGCTLSATACALSAPLTAAGALAGGTGMTLRPGAAGDGDWPGEAGRVAVPPGLAGVDALGVTEPGAAASGLEFPRSANTAPAPAAAATTATASIARARRGPRGRGGSGTGP